MSPDDAQGPPHSDDRSRFVLVCGGDAAAPPESLRRALSARDAAVTLRTNVYDAMADLVSHERERRAGAPGDALVLIVVEPDGVAQAGELVSAAGRFSPHAACWRFAESDQPQLRAFVTDRAPSPVTVRADVGDRVAPRAVARPTSTKPQLRLTGDPVETPGRDRTEEGEDDNAGRTLLSEEELEMLLSDNWDQTGDAGPS